MHPAKTIQLPLGISARSITAGSYRNYPGAGFYGIKLAPEVSNPADCIVPIPDFGLPKPQDMYSALRVALYRIALNQKVYVGCMGGYGRTGTFLALLYRFLGVEDSIHHVRQVYCGHAVETSAQKDFVQNLSVEPLYYDLLRAKYTAALVDRNSRPKGGGNGQGASPKKRDRKAERDRRLKRMMGASPVKFDWGFGPEPRWLDSALA